MTEQQDVRMLQELHEYATQLYLRNKQQRVQEPKLMAWLLERVEGIEADRILDIAEATGLLRPFTTGGHRFYIPAQKGNTLHKKD